MFILVSFYVMAIHQAVQLQSTINLSAKSSNFLVPPQDLIQCLPWATYWCLILT